MIKLLRRPLARLRRATGSAPAVGDRNDQDYSASTLSAQPLPGTVPRPVRPIRPQQPLFGPGLSGHPATRRNAIRRNDPTRHKAYPAQQPAQGCSGASRVAGRAPVCVRLEAQLASLNSGAADSARADQIKRAEDAIAKQQADLDRTTRKRTASAAPAKDSFSLFSGLSPQCGPLNSQIDQMRGNLDRMMSELEQLKSGGNDQDAQRTALIGQLAQNNCGAQYTAAARAAGPQGFFEALLGGGGTIVNPSGNGAPGRHLSHGLRAHLRRLLFPDFLFDGAEPVRRRCAGLPAAMPGGASHALHLSQSRRGDRASGFGRRRALHGAAQRVPLSQGGRVRLLVPRRRARPGRRRCATPTIPARWKAATSSSPTKTRRR